MRIGIAADHAGFALKEQLRALLVDDGYEVMDFGAFRPSVDDDYPDFVIPLAEAVSRGDVERGIALCGSGVGACVAANKVAGIRAALIHDMFTAHQGVEDDNMNIICLGGRVLALALVNDLVGVFLRARFRENPRHCRRLAKIDALEKERGGK
jgi:ribose 5-phosphate isomerase B